MRTCRAMSTPIKCAQSEMESLSGLRRIHGDELVISCMALWIDDLQSFLNISAKMNRFQIIETCSMILEDFYALNLADVRLVMTRAKKGQYGALYGRLDGQIVYQWFAEYFDERCAECGRAADAEAKVRDSQLAAMSPEQKKKILELWSKQKKSQK